MSARSAVFYLSARERPHNRAMMRERRIIGTVVLILSGSVLSLLFWQFSPSAGSRAIHCQQLGWCTRATMGTTAAPSRGTPNAVKRKTHRSTSLVFDDEFNGSIGTKPNPKKWVVRRGCPSSPNWLESCTSGRNAFLDGKGHLVLRVTKGTRGRPYDGAGVDTFAEGTWPPQKVLAEVRPPVRVAARIKFASGAGLWESFWMNSDSGAGARNLEVDVEEFRGLYAGMQTCGTHLLHEFGMVLRTHINLTKDWHTYWVDYRPRSMIFGIDHRTCGGTSLPSIRLGEMIRLTTHVGNRGTWGGIGGPPKRSALPAEMRVDYVRARVLPKKTLGNASPFARRRPLHNGGGASFPRLSGFPCTKGSTPPISIKSPKLSGGRSAHRAFSGRWLRPHPPVCSSSVRSRPSGF
jgi:hypothetical protein